MAIRPRLGALFGALLVAGAAGCSSSQLIADRMVPSLRDQRDAFLREESPRQAREATPALLTMLDGFIASSPRNRRLLLLGAELNAQAAFALLELEDLDWARSRYRVAKGYGLRALARYDSALHRALTAGSEAEAERALARVRRGDRAIPALFWAAFAWGGAIQLSLDDTDAVADLPRVVAVMERLAEVAPGFYHAGPHLFLAVYHASMGPALGGDLDRSQAHFTEVFDRTEGRLLMAHVLYAERYCVALGAREPAAARAAFREALDHVIAAPDDFWPEQRLPNTLAKVEAAALLAELDDLILPPLPDDDAPVEPER